MEMQNSNTVAFGVKIKIKQKTCTDTIPATILYYIYASGMVLTDLLRYNPYSCRAYEYKRIRVVVEHSSLLRRTSVSSTSGGAHLRLRAKAPATHDLRDEWVDRQCAERRFRFGRHLGVDVEVILTQPCRFCIDKH
jgi:hypothetical protein